MEYLTLDTRTLLVAARAVGLVVATHDGLLVVSGPKGAAGLVRLLLARESEILAVLAAGSSRDAPPDVSPIRAVAGPPGPSGPPGLAGLGPPPNDAQRRGEVPDSAYPDPRAGGLSDVEAVAAIDQAFRECSPARAGPTRHGPRDVRRGDRWLPWHARLMHRPVVPTD